MLYLGCQCKVQKCFKAAVSDEEVNSVVVLLGKRLGKDHNHARKKPSVCKVPKFEQSASPCRQDDTPGLALPCFCGRGNALWGGADYLCYGKEK